MPPHSWSGLNASAAPRDACLNGSGGSGGSVGIWMAWNAVKWICRDNSSLDVREDVA